MMRTKWVFLLSLVAMLLGHNGWASDIPADKRVGNPAGSLHSVGSDTLVYLMSFWTVEFKRLHPGAKVHISAAGSSTAPPALMDGSAQLGPMSRPMKDKELKAFKEKFGYEPMAFRVAVDGLAVYVNEKNPLKGLTFKQLDAVFSKTRQCGSEGDITRWEQLGLDGGLAASSIRLYGRDALSGTNAFFAKKALCKGEYKPSVKEQSSTAAIMRMVAADKSGIGYGGMGHRGKGIRALPLAKSEGEAFIAPTTQNIANNSYPLTRYLYIYVNKPPKQALSEPIRKFLRMVLSEKGQSIVSNDGFIPLDTGTLHQELARLN